MGNNESYSQVGKPTGKDLGDAPEEDLTFVFHTTDDDTADRVVHDSNLDFPSWPYAVTSNGRLIAERREFSEPLDLRQLLLQVKPGDAVEFIKPRKRYLWALYVGDDMFIYQKKGAIHEISSESFDRQTSYRGRIVSNVYRMKVLPLVQIINNAKSQIGKTLIWNCSESFAMWCRTGKAEFTNEESQIQNLDSNTPKIAKGKYMLEFHTEEESVMRRFQTLSDLVEYKRNVEKYGKDYLVNK